MGMSGNKDILTKWTLDREQVLRDNYTKKNIKASGKFGETIRHDVTDTSTTIYGNKYIGGTIYGRKPNTNQSKEALIAWAKAFAPIMQLWAKRKNIGDGSWGLGFAIAYKVAKRGWTIPNKHGNDGRLLKDTFTPEAIQEINKELGKFYLTETAQITKKTFEKWRQ